LRCCRSGTAVTGMPSDGQGGPVPAGAGHRENGAGHAKGVPADRPRAGSGSARSKMSLTRLARLPPCRMISRLSSRHSGWFGRMPRSRQISAMTAPIGWRRTAAAICSGVGRRSRPGSAASALPAAGWAPRGLSAGATLGVARGRGATGRGLRVQTDGVADEPFFERVGAVQALGDARDDPREVAGAEAACAGVGVDGAAGVLERGSEFLAVIDELADEREEAPDAAAVVCAARVGIGLGDWFGGGRRGGHERNENIGRPPRQGIFSVMSFVDA
jgi:hypothetical protein